MSIISKIKSGFGNQSKAFHGTKNPPSSATALGIAGVGNGRIRESHTREDHIESPRGAIENPAHPVDIMSAMKTSSTKGMNA